ncbi:MAG TPA: hypothetical protein VGE40_07845 [Bacilli bacterium]
MLPAQTANPKYSKFKQILSPNHTLLREDIIWVLDYIKEKVAEGDPLLLDLPEPRLLKNFHYFAKVALLLIHKRQIIEPDQLKQWLAEAAFGLNSIVHPSS